LAKVKRNERTRTGQSEENKNLVKVRENKNICRVVKIVRTISTST
jgi:hypothetical protein